MIVAVVASVEASIDAALNCILETWVVFVVVVVVVVVGFVVILGFGFAYVGSVWRIWEKDDFPEKWWLVISCETQPFWGFHKDDNKVKFRRYS